MLTVGLSIYIEIFLSLLLLIRNYAEKKKKIHRFLYKNVYTLQITVILNPVIFCFSKCSSTNLNYKENILFLPNIL